MSTALLQSRHVHRSSQGVEATWLGTGRYLVLGLPGVYIRRRRRGWWVYGVHATGHGPYLTLSGALESIAPDAHLSGRG